MIEIYNLNKKFEDNVIFRDFNLKIEDGQFIVLSGKSGCGKTTLLNMIGAIEKIDGGKILVDSVDISNRKHLLDYYRNTVGFLFQNFALVDNKTVKQNLEMVTKKYRNNITIEEVLKKVGLEDKLDETIYKLSGGEQQRVALARLMLKKCSIILADEPTGSLDKENADIVISILKELKNMGKTIIMVTHDKTLHQVGDRLINL